MFSGWFGGLQALQEPPFPLVFAGEAGKHEWKKEDFGDASPNPTVSAVLLTRPTLGEGRRRIRFEMSVVRHRRTRQYPAG